MGRGGERSGNIRNDIPGERLGSAKAHNNGQTGNTETSECRRQTGQVIGTFRGPERFRQIPLQLSRHQSQAAGQNRIRFISRKSGFREQDQGIEV